MSELAPAERGHAGVAVMIAVYLSILTWLTILGAIAALILF